MGGAISVWSAPSKKPPASRGSRFKRLSVSRNSKAPLSELIVPPSNRATISREPHPLNPKLDWIHSVIAKAVLSLALTAVWKLSYAMKDGLLPIAGEKSGLARQGIDIVKGDLDDEIALRRALAGAWGVFGVQNAGEAGG